VPPGGTFIPTGGIAIAEIHVETPIYRVTHELDVFASAYVDLDITMIGTDTTGYLQYQCSSPFYIFGFGFGPSCGTTLGSSITGPSIYGDQYFPFTYSSTFSFHVDAGTLAASEAPFLKKSVTLNRIDVYGADFGLLKTFTTAPDSNGQYIVASNSASLDAAATVPEPYTGALIAVGLSCAVSIDWLVRLSWRIGKSESEIELYNRLIQ
jgi:hypothetical protein